MVCLFTDCDEVLEWVDAFASASGLPSSDCTRILAEMVGFRTTSDLFNEVLNFERHEAHLDEDEVEELYNERDTLQDDEADDDDVTARFAHYRKVLTHHGFSDDFYNLFRKNLSPTSESCPQGFSIDPSLIFSSGYNKEPFFPDEAIDEVDEEDPDFDPRLLFEHILSDGPSMMDRMRLSRPVNPIGWQKMLIHLGFEIKPVESPREAPWFPRFYAFKDAVRHPVFVAGPAKAPYDTEDEQAKEIRDGIRDLNALSPADVPMLFWSAPLMVGDDNAPYWGEIRVDGRWHELFMSESVCRVDSILEVSKLMAAQNKSSYDKAVALLGDKDEKLIGWFMGVHVNPLLEMLGNIMDKRSKH